MIKRLTNLQSFIQYLATMALSLGVPLYNLNISFGPTSSLAWDQKIFEVILSNLSILIKF